MAGASAKVIPYGFHGMDMESIWINPGEGKDLTNALVDSGAGGKSSTRTTPENTTLNRHP